MDLMGIMKKAQEMQAKMAGMQAELEQIVVEGSAGGGVVKVEMSAKGELKHVEIDLDVLKPEDKEIVQDLIVAAHAEARRKAEAIAQEKMAEATAGLPLPPGMKLPF
ncbi:YbaB/EbfC family nucleoid-associated protein [Flaviflagellibacter deserti]|uniref:Nucleoid-associated protein ACFPFW_05650 n=1 Tax=Flaviflagellibacter deserti TaxID=2267266 RepID=A0ABV9Z0A1_9HYPH